MTRSARLKPILKIAEKREHYAALDMARAQQQLRYYEDKLEQLKSFRNDYNQKMSQSDRSGQTANSLNEMFRFMRQLDEGIAVLERQILQQKQQNLQDESIWREARLRTDALDNLMSRFAFQETSYVLDLEANELDDRTSPKKTTG